MASSIDQRCRLCMDNTYQKDKHLVFEKSLFHRILLVTSIEIQSVDTLPKCICNNCRYELEKSYVFRIKSKQVQTQLRKHVKLEKTGRKSTLLENSKFQDFDFNDDEIEEQLFLEACSFIKKIDLEKQSEITNMKSDMEQKLLKQKTDLLTEFEEEKKQILKDAIKKAQKAALKSVLEKTQRLLQDEINISDDDDAEVSELPTPTPPKPEPTEKRPIRNKKQNPNVNIVSVETPKFLNTLPLPRDPEESEKEVYTIVDGFKSENEDMDQEDMVYYDEVDENEANGADLKDHDHLLIVDYSNEEQEENSDSKNTENVNEKGELKIFKCQICDEGFTRAGFLKAHQAKHNKKGGYECPEPQCGKLFPTNHSLERHSRTHTGARPYKCDYDGCQKAFAQKEILKRHQLVHSGLTPFQCTLCTSEFRQKVLLKQHMQRKHSENPDEVSLKFKCIWCPKEFAHQSGLSRHNLTHTGKVFTCVYCQKSFSDNSALKRHEMTHIKKEVSSKKER